MHSLSLSSAAIAVLAAMPAAQAAMYSKSSPVLQVDAKDYDRLVAQSNHTSIVEFYAPWCGHCQNLKPHYEKAATNLAGLAKVVAVNCDEDSGNKAFCGSFGVTGFPTLKIVRPSPPVSDSATPKKTKSKPVMEDYFGPRTAAGIVEAVVEKINNHVKKVTDKDLDGWLKEGNDTAKAVLFTEKGTTSALLRAVAIDFLDVVKVAQIRNSQKAAVEKFGITKFPTLVLLPGGEADGIVYDGEMKKEALVKFFSQVGAPNPDPPAAKPKKEKAKKSSSSSAAASSATEAAGESADPTVQHPVVVETALPIPIIIRPEALVRQCLSPASKTCVLAFVPGTHGETAKKALAALAEISHKHSHQRNLFPMFEVHNEDAHSVDLLKTLGVTPGTQILAVNAKRSWWREYQGDFSHESIESWIDQIRMSEGKKNKLPAGVVSVLVEESEFEAMSARGEAPPAATPEAEPEPTPEATPVVEKAVPSESITPEAEEISTTTPAAEEPTAFSGADPTVEADTAKETPSGKPSHDEL